MDYIQIPPSTFIPMNKNIEKGMKFIVAGGFTAIIGLLVNIFLFETLGLFVLRIGGLLVFVGMWFYVKGYFNK